MLVTITDLRNVDGQTLRELGKTRYALCFKDTMIVSMSQEGARQALNARRTSAANTTGGPAPPAFPGYPSPPPPSSLRRLKNRRSES